MALSSSSVPDCRAADPFSVGRAAPGAAAVPLAPLNLVGSASGSTVTLTWSAPSGGDPPSSYIIEAGSRSGAADLVTFDTGTTAVALTVQSVPGGTYFVRVRAKNSAGISSPSNETIVSVGSQCTSPPNAPTGLAASVTGTSLTLTWSAPAAGCTPTGYVIEAGSASTLANLANFNTGYVTTTFSSSSVAAGTYYVRVRAANNYGVSAPSNEVQAVVGTNAPDPVSTFAANDTYDTVSGTYFGYTAVDAHDLAIAFTPSATTRLSSVELALSSASRNTLTVTVASDAGGVPGAALETFTLTGALTESPSIVTFSSAQHPALTGGTRYWITVSLAVAGASDFGKWQRSLLSVTGTTATRNSGGAWAAQPNDDRLQAFRVRFVG